MFGNNKIHTRIVAILTLIRIINQNWKGQLSLRINPDLVDPTFVMKNGCET